MTQTTHNRKSFYNPFDLFMHFQDHKHSAAYRMNFLLYTAISAIFTHVLLMFVFEYGFPGRNYLLMLFGFIAGGLLGVYIWRINAMRFGESGNGRSGMRLGAYVFAIFMIYSIAVTGTWLIVPGIHRAWLMPIGIVAILMLLEWIMARMFWLIYGLLILGFWLIRMEPGTNATLMIIAWIGILVAMTVLLPQKIWMIEIEHGQIYFHRPYYASKQNIELVRRPSSKLTPELRAKLEKYVSSQMIDDYVMYSAPKALEKTIRGQMSANLRQDYLDYVVKRLRTSGIEPIADDFSKFNAANQDIWIAKYCPPEVQAKIKKQAESVIEEFFNLWKKSDRDPVEWINPRDQIGRFWSWGSPVPISLSLDKVITQSESIVKIDLTFVVLPDPNIITGTQVFANFADTLDKSELINSVNRMFSGNAERKTREFFLTKSPYEISTLECLNEFRNYLANQALESIEKMMGVMVIPPSIQYTLKIDDDIEKASVESHIERIQSDVWTQILKKVGASNEDIRNFIFARGVLKHAEKADGLELEDIIPHRNYSTLTPTDDVVPPTPPKPDLPPPSSGQMTLPSTQPPPPRQQPENKQSDDDVIEGDFETLDIDDYDD